MCGRFQLSVTGKQISERFNVEVFDERYKPCYNCAPSRELPVITNDNQKELQFFRWGLIPFWAKDPKIGMRLINARAETLTDKPSFKHAFKTRRCLIPANGFFEWKKEKKRVPYRFFLKNDSLFAMAGLWDVWKDSSGKPVHSFTIVTTDANEIVKPVHDRMPVILPKEKERLWLEEQNPQLLQSLLQPYPGDDLEFYPVSGLINKPQNDFPEVVMPVK